MYYYVAHYERREKVFTLCLALGFVRLRGGVLARPRAEPMRVPATNDATICETGDST